jgi:DNA-binding transcriptional regulator/RsmH inhibitor MraZ
MARGGKMGEVVQIDSKGRIVIPRPIRNRGGSVVLYFSPGIPHTPLEEGFFTVLDDYISSFDV